MVVISNRPTVGESALVSGQYLTFPNDSLALKAEVLGANPRWFGICEGTFPGLVSRVMSRIVAELSGSVLFSVILILRVS